MSEPPILKVVKAFIVLNPEFRSHDQEKLVKELQQHVKSVTAPYKYPRKVSRAIRTQLVTSVSGLQPRAAMVGWGRTVKSAKRFCFLGTSLLCTRNELTDAH